MGADGVSAASGAEPGAGAQAGALSKAAASPLEARGRVLLAVDVPDLEAARELVERVADRVGGLKIGKELFTRCGPAAIRELSKFGLPVFLDLKFHDIPNTVAAAVQAAASHRVRWLSLHTSGGAAMLEAAVRARDALPEELRPKLLGVTVLTSLAADPDEVVDRALLAQRCGLDGAIASARDVADLRAACGDAFLLVTPGVRPEGATLDDQARVATPASAIRNGADLLVVGRPIRSAADPAAAARGVVEEVEAATDAAARTTMSMPAATPHPIEERLRRMLRESRAFLEGHFVLTSGLHSDRYVQCAKLLQHPRFARRAGTWLAERLRVYEPRVVISVALGGVVIGQEVALALGVRAVFAERDGEGKLALRRGFDLEPGERVAIVDDVCTRGTSIAECAALVEAHDASSVVAGSIIDRSGGDRAFALPLESLVRIDAIAVRPEDCQACASGVPVVKPGSRRQ